MVRLVLVTIISNPQKTIQVANPNKLTHVRPTTLFGICCANEPFAYQSPCGGHDSRSGAARRCRLFNVDRLFFSIFAIKLLVGWDTCRIKGTRIGGRIRPSAGPLLAKHHWVRIERWHRNESWMGNLAVPVFL